MKFGPFEMGEKLILRKKSKKLEQNYSKDGNCYFLNSKVLLRETYINL